MMFEQEPSPDAGDNILASAVEREKEFEEEFSGLAAEFAHTLRNMSEKMQEQQDNQS